MKSNDRAHCRGGEGEHAHMGTPIYGKTLPGKTRLWRSLCSVAVTDAGSVYKLRFRVPTCTAARHRRFSISRAQAPFSSPLTRYETTLFTGIDGANSLPADRSLGPLGRDWAVHCSSDAPPPVWQAAPDWFPQPYCFVPRARLGGRHKYPRSFSVLYSICTGLQNYWHPL